jgi:hypothetical protein
MAQVKQLTGWNQLGNTAVGIAEDHTMFYGRDLLIDWIEKEKKSGRVRSVAIEALETWQPSCNKNKSGVEQEFSITSGGTVRAAVRQFGLDAVFPDNNTKICKVLWTARKYDIPVFCVDCKSVAESGTPQDLQNRDPVIAANIQNLIFNTARTRNGCVILYGALHFEDNRPENTIDPTTHNRIHHTTIGGALGINYVLAETSLTLDQGQ